MRNKDKTNHIYYDAHDAKYAGAKTVVEAELKNLENRRPRLLDRDNLKGLALSGGGIRSASFRLGVIQAFASHNKLKLFDYLSTVSGGSYLGGSLSWLWLGKWREGTSCDREFGTDANIFPYGTGYRHSNNDPKLDTEQAALMRHLRQHGKYLTPGKGITALSLLSVVLRGITMGFVTLLVLASLFFHLMYYTPAYKVGYFSNTYILDAGLISVVAYLLCLLLYGCLALIFKGNAGKAYSSRRLWEKAIRIVLILSAAVLIVAVVHELKVFIDAEVKSAGGLSALLGALIAWYSQRSAKKSLNPNKKSILSLIPSSLLIYAGVILMFIGIFIFSEQIASSLYNLDHGQKVKQTALIFHVALSAIVLLFACLIPVNKVSIHRYYRDRLMETFDPDVCNVIGSGDTYVAKKANVASMGDCLPDDDNNMPYHIINTNIILVESEIAKFRGRGGDNFILSPLFSGSNATGWHPSNTFANNSITLPTAVAISGAAANSDSGVAGKGLTVNPLVSALMSIFNLRLGYWVVNPNTKYQPDQAKNPNYLKPGFRGIINRKKLNERANFVQLSDGGHFENLAMYELLRRHCRFIVCCDAEQDDKFVFGSLSNIIEKARVDFGVEIKISESELEKLKYHEDKNGDLIFAKQGYLVADIIYPHGEAMGKLVYIKTTLPENLPADNQGADRN